MGSCRPARARRTAVATASTASFWPTTRFSSSCLHLEQLFLFAFEHPVDRHAGPARHDLGDVVGGHRLVDEQLVALGLDLGELALEIGNDAIGEPAGFGVIALALRRDEIVAGGVELLLELVGGAELVLLGPPAGGQRRRFLLDLGEFGFELRQAILGGRVGLLAQRLLLDLELDDAAIELVELFGLRIDLDAQARGRLVDEVDRLVGEETIGNIAVRQGRRGDDRRIGDPHAVVKFVFFLEPAQDRDRILDRRLGHEDRLETAGECRVLLDMLAIFVERRRADAMQLAARQRRLQEIGRIHRPLGLAGADQRVHLVDEQDDGALRRGDLVEDGLQPLLEFAAIFGAGDERPHVEGEQLLVLEQFRHVAVDDAQAPDPRRSRSCRRPARR